MIHVSSPRCHHLCDGVTAAKRKIALGCDVVSGSIALPAFLGGLGLTARVVGLLQVAIAVPWPCGELLHCGFYFLLFFSLHPANVSKAFC
jgi:hypothetical protein